MAVSTLPLTGCQKIKEMTGQDKPESTEQPDATPPEAEPEAPANAPSEEAAVELATAKEAGLAEAALAPPPVAAAPMTGLDDLLALVPAGDIKGVAVVRDASVFLDYVDEGTNFLAGPLGRLGQAAATVPELAELSSVAAFYPMIKGQYDAAKTTIAASGVNLDKGIVFAEGANGNGVIIYSGTQPDALPNLIKAIDSGSDITASCKNIDSAAGYVVCADAQADLDAYAPGGPEGAAALRSRLANNLPGVDFETANIIFDVADEDLHMTIDTPPGLMVMSMAPPQNDEDLREMAQALTPGPGKLLRGVQPGAGFMWANISPTLLAQEMMADIAADPSAPQSVKDLASQFTGEFLVAGHYQPAVVALQVGLNDDAAWAGVATDLEAVLPKVQDEIGKELKLPGAEWDVGLVDVTVGESAVKAMHAGLSGVPEANVLAQLTGLTIDGWVFAANDALHVALGATPEAIGHVADAAFDGPSDGLKAYLPPTLTSALAANQVSMIAHLPLDAIHSPQTRELIKTALKNVKEVDPELVIAFFDLMSPLSSGTMWMTHSGGKVQLHVAMQAIGHHADDEGKAALAAAAAVASGADPAATYGPLTSQYASSPRVAAYKARAGQTEAALVASGVGALVAAGALAYPIMQGQRNEAITEELHIEDNAAEKAKEDSKADAEEAPKPKPKPKPKPEPKPEPEDKTDPTPTPTPTPEPTPPPDPTPTPDNADDDGGAPKPPPIIPGGRKKIPRPR